MNPKVCIVDTNVVVGGLFSAKTNSPPARILDAMLEGKLLYLLSATLVDEYSSVLRRPKLSRRHGLTGDEIDHLLAELVANAIWREPVESPDNPAPDRGDDHLWALLGVEPGCLLVTGDRALIENPPERASVISPAEFVNRFPQFP